MCNLNMCVRRFFLTIYREQLGHFSVGTPLEWTSLCSLSEFLFLVVKLHVWHEKKTSECWVCLCNLRFDMQDNFLLHISHLWTSLLTWTLLTCLSESRLFLNTFLHWSHWDSFVISWSRLWFINPFFCLKALKQIKHSKCFSSLCTVKWLFNPDDWENSLLHTLHLNAFSPVCVRMWTVNDNLFLKLIN